MSDLTEFVATARQAYERVCIDSCVITRPAAAVFNEATGQYSTSTSSIYTGPCRLQVATTADTPTMGAEVQASRHILTLPWAQAAVTTVAAGDRVVVTSSDPLANGHTLTVVSEEAGSTASARRFIVELVA